MRDVSHAPRGIGPRSDASADRRRDAAMRRRPGRLLTSSHRQVTSVRTATRQLHGPKPSHLGARRRRVLDDRHRRRAHRPERGLSSRERQPAARAAATRRRLVPFDRGQRFTFDYAGHIMFSNDPYVHELYQHAARRQRALAGSRSMDLQQGRLHALSVPGRAVRLAAGRASRNASSARSRPASASLSKSSHRGRQRARTTRPRCVGEPMFDNRLLRRRRRAGTCCAARAERPSDSRQRERSRAISRSSSTRCGAPASPSTSRFPTTASSGRCRWTEMETSWLGGRVPLPDLEEMIDGALRRLPKPMGPNARSAIRCAAASRRSDERVPAAPAGRAARSTQWSSRVFARRHTR